MAEYVIEYPQGERCFFLYDSRKSVLALNRTFSGILDEFLNKYLFSKKEEVTVEVRGAIPYNQIAILELMVRVHNRILAKGDVQRSTTSALVEAALE